MVRVIGTVLLLVCSNTFMTFAWYYHLKKPGWGLLVAIGISWLIALPDDSPVERAGQLMNPITAWDLVTEARVAPGQWLAVTAGYSSISTMVRLSIEGCLRASSEEPPSPPPMISTFFGAACAVSAGWIRFSW